MIARGLPLAERNGEPSGRRGPGDAAQRLASWRAQPPFSTGTWWQARLAAAALTERVLLSLLGEPGSGIAARVPVPGGWNGLAGCLRTAVRIMSRSRANRPVGFTSVRW
jgi:hypothetical protein